MRRLSGNDVPHPPPATIKYFSYIYRVQYKEEREKYIKKRGRA